MLNLDISSQMIHEEIKEHLTQYRRKNGLRLVSMYTLNINAHILGNWDLGLRLLANRQLCSFMVHK